MSAPRCPRCGSTDVRPCDVIVHGSTEQYRATHECVDEKCASRFRYTPPDRPADEEESWVSS